MKKKSFFAASVSALLVAVLAIMAFIRGPLEVWFLAGAFLIWGAVVVIYMLAGRAGRRRYAVRRRNHSRAPAVEQDGFVVPDIEGINDTLLLKHVNHRITAYLRSAYPDVTWQWCSKEPERLVSEGGAGRIQLFGIPDFNYAEVLFDRNARMEFGMMKVVPLAALNGQPQTEAATAPSKQPADVAVWFDLQGRTVLEELVADLNSRGHSSLSIKENGEVCIQQADAEVPQSALKNLPGKAYWPRIAKLLEKEGLAAAVTDDRIKVSW